MTTLDFERPIGRIISLPRSGHHYVVSSLAGIEPTYFNYCEAYNCEDAFGRPIECVYEGRRPAPFCSAGRTFLKSHDFLLRDKPSSGEKVLVLFRKDFEAAIRSWFLKETATTSSEAPRKLRLFRWLVWPYCEGFVHKWSQIAETTDNVMVVAYEELSAGKLRDICSFFEFPSRLSESDISERTTSFKSPLPKNNEKVGIRSFKVCYLSRSPGVGRMGLLIWRALKRLLQGV